MLAQNRTTYSNCWWMLLCVLAATFGAASTAGAERPYCRNVVVPVSFQAQGTWLIGGVAAKAETVVKTHSATRGLVGSRLIVTASRAELRTRHNKLWKNIFPLRRIDQQTYDTRSREFWLDFRTAPASLQLPRYVNATDVEIGTIVATGANRVYLDVEGKWFLLTREGRQPL